MHRISEIRFPCRWTDDRVHGRVEVCKFGLGIGPCGKRVSELFFTIADGMLRIDQICPDERERKTFYYMLTDITGRIEVTYA